MRDRTLSFCQEMKLTGLLVAGILLPALCGCDDSEGESGAPPWPLAPDRFEWPATQDDAIEFETVANANLSADVKKAAATLESHFSLESVTFSRTDLNHDGQAEILIKAHHYGFAPSYAILTRNDSGDYSDIGWITGGEVFKSKRKRTDEWQSIQTLSGKVHRRLYSFRDGVYQATRAELFDPATDTLTILSPNKAEQNAAMKNQRKTE